MLQSVLCLVLSQRHMDASSPHYSEGSFRGLVVMASVLQTRTCSITEDPRFDPGREQLFFFGDYDNYSASLSLLNISSFRFYSNHIQRGKLPCHCGFQARDALFRLTFAG